MSWPCIKNGQQTLSTTFRNEIKKKKKRKKGKHDSSYMQNYCRPSSSETSNTLEWLVKSKTMTRNRKLKIHLLPGPFGPDKELASAYKIYFFSFLLENRCYGYSLEVPPLGEELLMSSHMFSWRNKKINVSEPPPHPPPTPPPIPPPTLYAGVRIVTSNQSWNLKIQSKNY